MYLLRLDDASEYMLQSNWCRMEKLLDKYCIKPIVGVIPDNKDKKLLQFGKIDHFWELVKSWKAKGWTIALHGYTHVYETDEGGINPVNKRSEFAGLPLANQKEKISSGYSILLNHDIHAEIFYAPSHTFDLNTLIALKNETDIRVISDTVANDVYYENDFYFIPQQSGSVRKLPFKLLTFCYHPNTMKDDEFNKLESFLSKYSGQFGEFNKRLLKKKSKSTYDKVLKKLYFMRK